MQNNQCMEALSYPAPHPSTGSDPIHLPTHISEHGLSFGQVELPCPQPAQIVWVRVVRLVWNVPQGQLEVLQGLLLMGTQVSHVPTHCLFFSPSSLVSCSNGVERIKMLLINRMSYVLKYSYFRNIKINIKYNIIHMYVLQDFTITRL